MIAETTEVFAAGIFGIVGTVFGVFLGFILENYNENKKQKREFTALKRKIVSCLDNIQKQLLILESYVNEKNLITDMRDLKEFNATLNAVDFFNSVDDLRLLSSRISDYKSNTENFYKQILDFRIYTGFFKEQLSDLKKNSFPSDNRLGKPNMKTALKDCIDHMKENLSEAIIEIGEIK